MSPTELAAYLTVMRDAGVRRGVLVVADSRVEFELAPPVPAGALIDRDGKPVNLDEGNPWTEDADAKMYEANFKRAG